MSSSCIHNEHQFWQYEPVECFPKINVLIRLYVYGKAHWNRCFQRFLINPYKSCSEYGVPMWRNSNEWHQQVGKIINPGVCLSLIVNTFTLWNLHILNYETLTVNNIYFSGFDSVEDLSMSSCASSHHSGDPPLLWCHGSCTLLPIK